MVKKWLKFPTALRGSWKGTWKINDCYEMAKISLQAWYFEFCIVQCSGLLTEVLSNDSLTIVDLWIPSLTWFYSLI